MKELWMNQYISKITPEIIQQFGNDHQIYLTNEEAKFIEYKIKTEWKTLMYGDSTFIFNSCIQKLGMKKTNQIKSLYDEYKEKYKYYL